MRKKKISRFWLGLDPYTTNPFSTDIHIQPTHFRPLEDRRLEFWGCTDRQVCYGL